VLARTEVGGLSGVLDFEPMVSDECVIAANAIAANAEMLQQLRSCCQLICLRSTKGRTSARGA
jgi:hypothetical protein